MKYVFTEETKKVGGRTLHRIKAASNFAGVKAGEIGGWIEKESNLDQEGHSWIFNNACVFDNARVLENACVFDNAYVYGNAIIAGEAEVYDDSVVADNVAIVGGTTIYGNSIIFGSTKIKGEADIHDSFLNNCGISAKGKIKNIFAENTKFKGSITLNEGVFKNAFVKDNNCCILFKDGETYTIFKNINGETTINVDGGNYSIKEFAQERDEEIVIKLASLL